jgi:hypothetical protein
MTKEDGVSNSWQYWAKPKRAKVSRGEAWWYAMSRGSIELHVAEGPTHFTVKIQAAQLREFINMLDNHKP